MKFPPSVDFAAEFSNRKDPLLPPDGMEVCRFTENQQHVFCGNESQFSGWQGKVGENLSKGLDAGPDSLNRNACVDQTLGGLEGDEILQAVSVVPALGSRRGYYEIGLGPVLKLASGNAKELENVPGAKEFWGRRVRSEAFESLGSNLRLGSVLPSGELRF
jgi:hypothetical protein